MTDELEAGYLKWLSDQVGALEYMRLTNEMYNVTFNASVPNDDNRAAEGKNLRTEYLSIIGQDPSDHYQWLAVPCTLLEMLVGLTARAQFMSGMPAIMWFGIFLDNLGLQHYNDDDWKPNHRRIISAKLVSLNERTYERTGSGGLFPVYQTNLDQRTVEIWYQMCAYIQENGLY
jgi:hypothetical protein